MAMKLDINFTLRSILQLLFIMVKTDKMELMEAMVKMGMMVLTVKMEQLLTLG